MTKKIKFVDFVPSIKGTNTDLVYIYTNHIHLLYFKLVYPGHIDKLWDNL